MGDERSHLTGAERIAEERHRQVALGWSRAHDIEHDDGALLKAAALYVRAAQIDEGAPAAQESVRRVLERYSDIPYNVPEADEDYRLMVINPARHYFGWDKAPGEWPFEPASWKPSPDAIRNLEKAGALIAAEIDRLGAKRHHDARTGSRRPT